MQIKEEERKKSESFGTNRRYNFRLSSKDSINNFWINGREEIKSELNKEDCENPQNNKKWRLSHGPSKYHLGAKYLLDAKYHLDA